MYLSFEDCIGIFFKKSHNAIYDPEYQDHLKKAPWEHWLSQNNYFDVTEEYIEAFIHWIYSGKNNQLSNACRLNSKRYLRKDVIVGTTQSFDEAYFRYHNRRLRIFRGEYAYHRRCYKNFAWLDKPLKTDPGGDWAEPLESGDWVIVSHPFCGSGEEHPKLGELFKKCVEKNIPLVLDCAWFGTCFDLKFDLEHPAITEVSFSLSKGIGLGSMRTGLRFSNYSKTDKGFIAQQNEYKHLVLNNCQLGIYQMEKFNPDWQTNKYLNWYKKLCSEYSLLQTKCLHISRLPLYSKYAEFFLIDDSYVKVGVREALKAVRQKRLRLSND